MHTSRRAFLAATGAAATTGAAGCLDNSKYEKVEELPRPTLGPDDAPVTMQLFEDYACPACKQFNDRVKPDIVEEYVEEGILQIEFYDYPIPVDGTWSWRTAIAARAVQDEAGNDAFWEYNNAMFDNQSRLGYETIETVAMEMDLDAELIVDKTDDGVYRPVVNADRTQGKNQGVQGTPGVFINGQLVGRPDYGTIARAIDRSH